ncbi:hypothetical protein [Pseudonocardia sediminis]|uniref:hypothetical protein n=1 Tax=Pseudonocardia sediminis TaxID=1397368 RepID=UPI001028B8ED|nr:hypothetical protein [Pseudonocardia sediminis]
MSVEDFDDVLKAEIRDGQWSYVKARRPAAPSAHLQLAVDKLRHAWIRSIERERLKTFALAKEAQALAEDLQSTLQCWNSDCSCRTFNDVEQGGVDQTSANQGWLCNFQPRFLMEIQPLDEVDFVLPWQESTNPNVILLPEASGFSIDWAIDAARGLLLDAIAQSPPDLLLINWIDTTAVFENLAGFSEFARKAPAFFRYQAMHTTAEMKRVLDAIWLEVEDVYDSCISHNFRDLADHNKFATNAEAYRVLIVTGFPQRFDKRSAEILARLSRHGRRAGLSLILVADPVVANSLASINRLGHIHELQDIPVSIDSLPSWWGPDTLPSGRLIIGANNRSYTPTLVAQGDVTYLTICRLKHPDDDDIRRVSQNYLDQCGLPTQMGVSPRTLAKLREDPVARRSSLLRAMLHWLRHETMYGGRPCDWEGFIGARHSHLGGQSYSRGEILHGAEYLYDKDFIEAAPESNDLPAGTSWPRISSKGVDMVDGGSVQDRDDFSTASRRVKNETNFSGPVIMGDSHNSHFAWSQSGSVSQANPTSSQVAPGFEEVANAVNQTLANLSQIGLAPDDANDAEASAHEILVEVEKEAPDRGRIRRALAALRGLIMPIANQAALGAGEGAHDAAKAALDHLQGLVF